MSTQSEDNSTATQGLVINANVPVEDFFSLEADTKRRKEFNGPTWADYGNSRKDIEQRLKAEKAAKEAKSRE